MLTFLVALFWGCSILLVVIIGSLIRDREVRKLGIYVSMFKHSPIGMSVLDESMRFVDINNNLADINGLARLDHIGKHLSEVIPDVYEFVRGYYEEVLRTGNAIMGVEVRGMTPARSEERIWVVDYYPMQDSRGKIYVGCVVRDVTLERLSSDKAEEATTMLLTIRREQSANGLAPFVSRHP